jgi:hypothetical protein
MLIGSSMLNNAFYNSESQSFTFESYGTLLQHAFTDLEQSGDPLSALLKAWYFLKRIKDVVIDTQALNVPFYAAEMYATRVIVELQFYT